MLEEPRPGDGTFRSKVPRRRDFNNLYTYFKVLKYGSLNMDSMFKKMEENVKQLIAVEPEYAIKYNLFNAQENSPFILALVTPLMRRVHDMVRYLFGFQ